MSRRFAIARSGAALGLILLGAGAAPASAARVLSIDVNAARGGDYTAAFELALAAGLSEIGLSFPWTSIEVAPGVYDNADLGTANSFYPGYGVPVRLMISPVQTNMKVVPSDLGDTPFDDPELIARFNAMLDWVATQIPDVTVAGIILGNEYDVYLGQDPAAWAAYTAFYSATAAHARALWPGARISAEATLPGAIGPMLAYNRALNQHSDVLSVSYYPLTPSFTVQSPQVVQGAFDQICALYVLPIDFEEIGYPSGDRNKSSPAQQAEFVHEVFLAWDRHAAQVRMVDFTWMHDLPPGVARLIGRIYGVRNPRFTAYIATLGLRNFDGTDKPAWTQLEVDAAARGFPQAASTGPSPRGRRPRPPAQRGSLTLPDRSPIARLAFGSAHRAGDAPRATFGRRLAAGFS
jgi:hypothetical protein